MMYPWDARDLERQRRFDSLGFPQDMARRTRRIRTFHILVIDNMRHFEMGEFRSCDHFRFIENLHSKRRVSQ